MIARRRFREFFGGKFVGVLQAYIDPPMVQVMWIMRSGQNPMALKAFSEHPSQQVSTSQTDSDVFRLWLYLTSILLLYLSYPGKHVLKRQHMPLQQVNVLV
jgi:hypothetical protein